MKGGKRKNLTEIIWKLTNKKVLDDHDKKIVKRITDGYTNKEYNLAEENSIIDWWRSEAVSYFKVGKVTSGNEGISNVKYDNLEAVPAPSSIIKILKLAKPEIPEKEINEGLSNNGGTPIVKKEENRKRTLRVGTPQLKASSDSPKVTIDELLKDMEEFQSTTLPPLVEKSQKTLIKVTEYITKLTTDIKTGKTSSTEAALRLEAANKGLQEQISILSTDKINLQKKIEEAATVSANTQQQLSEKNKDIITLNENIKKQNERIESILITSDELRQKTTASTLKQAEELKKYNEELSRNRDLLDKETKAKQELQKKLEQQTNDINNMKIESKKLDKINTYFKGIKQQTTALSNNNEGIKQFINGIVEKEKIEKNKQSNTGGYQYKSKNKTRSKRMLKLNRFGLLKSKSKTRKGKKKLKVKKNKKSVKGGMKTRSKAKRRSKKGKKTRKGKKKNNKRK